MAKISSSFFKSKFRSKIHFFFKIQFFKSKIQISLKNPFFQNANFFVIKNQQNWTNLVGVAGNRRQNWTPFNIAATSRTEPIRKILRNPYFS